MKINSILKPRKIIGIVLLLLVTHSRLAFASVTLTSPASSALVTASSDSFTLNYSISEAPITGTVNLVFSNMSVTRTIHLNDSQTASFSINPKLNLASTYPSHITSVDEGTNIPDGTYSVVLSYINGGGTVSSDTKTGVIIKTSTNPATVYYPVSGTTYTNSIPIQFSLPDSATSNTRRLVFTKTGLTITIYLKDTTLTSFNLNPTSDPATNINVLSSSASSIPDGSYSVQFIYQDNYLNPVGTSTAITSVAIDNNTISPTLTSPATGTTYDNSPLPIQFTLPESALSGSRKLTFTNGSGSIVLTLKDTTLTSFNLDPTLDPTSNSNVQSATATSIPNGTYTVSFTYQDALGNPVATSTSTNVIISQSTAAPASASGSSSSGGGCGYIEDNQKRKNGSIFEPFIWMMICAGFVLILRNRRIFERSNS